MAQTNHVKANPPSIATKTEEQIETALIPLMAEVFHNETFTVK